MTPGRAPEALGPSPGRPARRRTVAARVLFAFAIVTFAFSAMAGWAVTTLRSASREAVLMRSGYLPLALALRNSVAGQDVWNTQLNHVTTAKNPADQRAWFDIVLRGGRPATFQDLRAALARAFVSEDEAVRVVGRELAAEATAIERSLDADRELVPRLFEALSEPSVDLAEEVRLELATRGQQAKKKLALLESRVDRLVDSLIAEARARERWAMRLLVGLAVLSILIGAAMALHVGRVLAPLVAVTARAEAVARGDLTPRLVVASEDEIGELATTFESMVTAIAHANTKLVAAERLATIGKMAAHVTHEIRNPLSSLALNVELLEEELANDKPEARALQRAIRGEVERLTALSERYLSVARRKAPDLEAEDIGDLCREVLDLARPDLEQHGVALRSDLPGEVLSVRVDEGQIRQVLHNLLRNAREAMPDGGTVTLGARRTAEGGVEIAVDDEGSGIDAATRARLFEPFVTTKANGTGLGLAITREIVEAHGGRIACSERSPRGTRFIIALPGAPGHPGAVET